MRKLRQEVAQGHMGKMSGLGKNTVSFPVTSARDLKVAPEENMVTLTKIEAPMKSSSGPWNAAISVSFWRETWPWPFDICSRDRREERRDGFLRKWRRVEGGAAREWSGLGHLHPLQGALNGDPAGIQFHPEDGQGMSVHRLIEYIPGE